MFQHDDGDDDIDESRVDLASEWIWGRRGCGGGVTVRCILQEVSFTHMQDPRRTFKGPSQDL